LGGPRVGCLSAGSATSIMILTIVGSDLKVRDGPRDAVP
jgi:hypothetical protein